ncbi:hypothetical protein [Litoribrevibacter albus]|uniref:Uncharacterized protein n=1 Tax=Litoribrevibacter albus TaxID=1473156 RepID=A0AA37W7T3_9GAMM|nr:hypothetical protein [Litoribrevibacter albus]GLQ30791.1 hypothetical protein GCM10007876_12700 [Litoribrevibacter albus]
MAEKTADPVAGSSTLDPKLASFINTELKVNEVKAPNDYEVLTKVALEALKFFPPFYFKSIFGSVKSWLPPHRDLSEYTVLSPWRPARALNYLVDTTVPAFSHAPGPWASTLLPPFVRDLFWRPSNYFQQADPFDCVTTYSDEHWFFLNGIATNQAVAEMNSSLISEMFLRPVTVIHNETDSTVLDLIQCAIGKSFKTDPSLNDAQSMTEPAVKATVAILEALKDPARNRVVLLCHSQGTIIAANVLRALQRCFENIRRLAKEPDAKPKLTLDLLDELALGILYTDQLKSCDCPAVDRNLLEMLCKLEVYTFANCADKMNYITSVKDASGKAIGLPYIENFANEFDLVARLGVLSPLKGQENYVEIDGPVYEKKGLTAWGHLLNQHYLFGVDNYLEGKARNPYVLSDNSSQAISELPRLYEYASGKRPSAYY